jgi:hypothetical protein
MLNCYPEKRTLAQQVLKHTWLYRPCPEEYLMYARPHAATTSPTSDCASNATTSPRNATSSTSTSPRTRTARRRTTAARRRRSCTSAKRWARSS